MNWNLLFLCVPKESPYLMTFSYFIRRPFFMRAVRLNGFLAVRINGMRHISRALSWFRDTRRPSFLIEFINTWACWWQAYHNKNILRLPFLQLSLSGAQLSQPRTISALTYMIDILIHFALLDPLPKLLYAITGKLSTNTHIKSVPLAYTAPFSCIKSYLTSTAGIPPLSASL